MIETVTMQWIARVPLFHLETSFQALDKRIAKLDSILAYPPNLRAIYLFAPPWTVDKPDQSWYGPVFSLATSHGVGIFTE
jgi:hypothetical protein